MSNEKKRTSVYLKEDILSKIKGKNIKISGTVSDLLDMYIKNGFSMDFADGNKNNTNVIADKRKINFLKRMCRILDQVNTDMKKSNYNTKTTFPDYMEILSRHGLAQDDYMRMKELINNV